MSKALRELEQRIVRTFVDKAMEAGYRLTVSLERGYDLDECLIASSNADEIMAAAFAGDEAHLFIHKAGEPAIENGSVNCKGWVRIVLGNDGWDVICDYSANAITERLLEDANKLADSYA